MGAPEGSLAGPAGAFVHFLRRTDWANRDESYGNLERCRPLWKPAGKDALRERNGRFK